MGDEKDGIKQGKQDNLVSTHNLVPENETMTKEVMQKVVEEYAGAQVEGDKKEGDGN